MRIWTHVSCVTGMPTGVHPYVEIEIQNVLIENNPRCAAVSYVSIFTRHGLVRVNRYIIRLM